MDYPYPSKKVWELLRGSMFHISLNANDFFAYCCAESVEFCPCDSWWAFPIIDEFGDNGLSAVMSFIENCEPIKEIRTKEFKLALKKIKKLDPLVFSRINNWTKEERIRAKKEDYGDKNVSR